MDNFVLDLMALIAPPWAGTPSLIANGGMENGSPPAGWVQGADLPALSSAADQRTGGSGAKSLDVAISAGQAAGTVVYALTGLRPGKSYRLTGWVKNIDADYNVIVVYNSAWSVLALMDNLHTGAAWTYYSHEFTANDATGYLLLVVHGDPGEHVRYDDFSLREISTVVYGPDLVTLGNMESGDPPNGWTSSGGTPVLAAAADQRPGGIGTQALDITIAVGQTQGAAQNGVTLSTEVGKTYQVNAWLKNVDLTTGIRVVIFDAGFNILATGETQSGTGWIESQFSFEAATATAIIYLQALGTAGQHGLADDVSVRLLPNP